MVQQCRYGLSVERPVVDALGDQRLQLALQEAGKGEALVDQCRGQTLELALVLVHHLQELLTILLGQNLCDFQLASLEGLSKRCWQVVLWVCHVVSLSKPNTSA